MCLNLLQNSSIFTCLLEIDQHIAEEARQGGCPACGGPLHWANYPRKPRGGADGLGDEHRIRLSLCCGQVLRSAKIRDLCFGLEGGGQKVPLGDRGTLAKFWRLVALEIEIANQNNRHFHGRKLQKNVPVVVSGKMEQ